MWLHAGGALSLPTAPSGPGRDLDGLHGTLRPDAPHPVNYVWQAGHGYCISRLNFDASPEGGEMLTRYPVNDDYMIWICAWILSEFEYSNISASASWSART